MSNTSNFMKELIDSHFKEGIDLRNTYLEQSSDLIASAALILAECLKAGSKILLCGNGGSSADAQHIAAEFEGRFEIDRPPLAAIALSTNMAALTAVGNDFGFSEIFARQVRALGRAGDVLIGISTSGLSPNVVKAIEAAKEMEIFTIGLFGSPKANLPSCDLVITVPHHTTALIQEIHISTGHIICRLVDSILFGTNIK